MIENQNETERPLGDAARRVKLIARALQDPRRLARFEPGRDARETRARVFAEIDGRVHFLAFILRNGMVRDLGAPFDEELRGLARDILDGEGAPTPPESAPPPAPAPRPRTTAVRRAGHRRARGEKAPPAPQALARRLRAALRHTRRHLARLGAGAPRTGRLRAGLSRRHRVRARDRAGGAFRRLTDGDRRCGGTGRFISLRLRRDSIRGGAVEETSMSLSDLFDFEKFVAPQLIRFVYWMGSF